MSELVRDHEERCSSHLSQKLAHEAFDGFPVLATLNKNVEDKAILIDGGARTNASCRRR